jgi:hypothetical protein
VSNARPLDDEAGVAIDRIEAIIGHDKRIGRVAQIGINAGDFVVVRVWVSRPEAVQVRFDLDRAIEEEFQDHPPVAEQAKAAD